jgi:hypothetical protein
MLRRSNSFVRRNFVVRHQSTADESESRQCISRFPSARRLSSRHFLGSPHEGVKEDSIGPTGPELSELAADQKSKRLTRQRRIGGREGIRTPDPLLAKQVLSQLSYTPTKAATLILKHFRVHRIFAHVLRSLSVESPAPTVHTIPSSLFPTLVRPAEFPYHYGVLSSRRSALPLRNQGRSMRCM